MRVYEKHLDNDGNIWQVKTIREDGYVDCLMIASKMERKPRKPLASGSFANLNHMRKIAAF